VKKRAKVTITVRPAKACLFIFASVVMAEVDYTEVALLIEESDS